MPKLSTLIRNPLFCSVPWVHTEIDVPNDVVRTCPRGTFEMGKFSDGVPIVWTNDKYTKLRQDFMDNIQSNNCVDCASGGDTKTFRSDKNDSFMMLRFLHRDSADIISPKSVEVNLSNVSDVAVRYSYANESTMLNDFISRSTDLAKYISPSNSTIPTIDSFRGAFNNVEVVMISGGEPFMFPGIVDLIDLIVQESNGNLKKLVIFTSMTYKNQALLDKLQSLSDKVSIGLNIHIDGPKDIYQYIRHGASYDSMIANLKEVAGVHRYIKFNAVFGISILNVGYITDVLETINNIQKESNLSIRFLEAVFSVDNASFLYPTNLPYSIKQQYLNKINQYDFSKITVPQTRTILLMVKNMLTSPPQNSMADFYEYIAAFDAVAGTDYKTIYPELAVGAPSGN